jgi:hypothetical protein
MPADAAPAPRPAERPEGSTSPVADLPPWHVWAAAALVAALRAIPYFATRIAAADDPLSVVPAGYVAKDWLAYAALIRQPAAGLLTLADPFTTDPQDGRFVLLLHQALNAVHRLTGADPFALLEASRVPLLAALTWTLWRFLTPILPARGERAMAAWLVLLGVGFHPMVRLLEPVLPPGMARTVDQDLWSAYGWSGLEASYNPLWLAGLTGILLLARPALAPGPWPTRARALAAAGWVVLWFTHPYSALAFAVVLASACALEWMLGAGPARAVAWMPAMLPAAALVGALALWQREDPVFAAASGRIVGALAAPVFWYPVTLGVIGVLALQGGRAWIAQQHPWRHAMGGWWGGMALLHSSDVLEGYHFVPYLWIPVCILAAPRAAAILAGVRGNVRARVPAGLLAVALAAPAAVVTMSDTTAAAAQRIGPPERSALAWLSGVPAGNVLCSQALGNLVPAFTPHRVYLGHWFMTPDAGLRGQTFDRIVADPEGQAHALLAIVLRHRIDYVVVPPWVGPRIAAAMGGLAGEVVPLGPAAVVVVRRPR